MGIFNLLKVASDLLKCDRADASYVTEIQEQRLRAILRHAVEHSEYYRSLYQGIDIGTCRLDELPVVTKAEMMKNFDRLVTDKRLKHYEIRNWLEINRGTGRLYLKEFIPFLTSGTTTEPALVIYSRRAMDVVHAGIVARQPFVEKPFSQKLHHYVVDLLNKPIIS